MSCKCLSFHGSCLHALATDHDVWIIFWGVKILVITHFGIFSWKTCFGKLIGEPKNAFFSLKFFLDITNSHLIQFCVSWYKATLTGPRVLHRVGNLECIFYCWNPIFLCSGTLIFIKFNIDLVWLFGKLQ